MSTQNISEMLALARSITEASGHYALQHFRQTMSIDNKLGDGAFDPVTEGDRGVERAIREGLARHFPDHGIVGEEFGTTYGDSEYSWIIDPIDGTRSFISGFPTWATLLGLRKHGEPVAGLMHQPFTGETFVGISGETTRYYRGADSAAMAVRPCKNLMDAVLYCTDPDMFVTEAEKRAFAAVEKQVRLRRFGGDCYQYAQLAYGQVDLIIESSLQPYDIQAIIPIVEGAGGIVSDGFGNSAKDGGFVVAAATKELHQQALALIQTFLKGV